jgi:glycosyltransferase involved in cell wall biosynthesis
VTTPDPGAARAERPGGGELAPDVEEALGRLGRRDVVVALLTYNNAETAGAVATAAAQGLGRELPTTAALVNVDAGSSDGTTEAVTAAGLPTVRIAQAAPLAERLTVPFHGVPGRGAALRAAFVAAHRLGARAVVGLEADLASPSPEWVTRLARPVLEEKADLVVPVYARHRYEGTVTNLLLAPMVRALYGRRIRQPFAGQHALSGRLVEHLLIHPQWSWHAAEPSDLWMLGAAIADGFAVWEVWLGRRVIRSRLRTTDLPTMVAQTLGAVFTVMHRHQDLWLEVRGSEPVPEVGEHSLPGVEPVDIDVGRMIEGFRLGLRDLAAIWDHVLAPETLADVLSLDPGEGSLFQFPDDLWARVVYDFALGHHYDVVYRDHLLRSLVPLYLGRTAAFVLGTRGRSAEATEAAREEVGAAFEREKPYLVERWR